MIGNAKRKMGKWNKKRKEMRAALYCIEKATFSLHVQCSPMQYKAPP